MSGDTTANIPGLLLFASVFIALLAPAAAAAVSCSDNPTGTCGGAPCNLDACSCIGGTCVPKSSVQLICEPFATGDPPAGSSGTCEGSRPGEVFGHNGFYSTFFIYVNQPKYLQSPPERCFGLDAMRACQASSVEETGSSRLIPATPVCTNNAGEEFSCTEACIAGGTCWFSRCSGGKGVVYRSCSLYDGYPKACAAAGARGECRFREAAGPPACTLGIGDSCVRGRPAPACCQRGTCSAASGTCCIETDDDWRCEGNSDCCGGLCDLGGTGTCVSCLSEGARTCTAEGGQAECCGGLTCQGGTCGTPKPPNRPPAKPPLPTITPASITTKGSFYCTSNCPPPPEALPSDPDGDAVSIAYQWYRNNAPVAGQAAGAFDCSRNGCAAGDRIKISSRACDGSQACSDEAFSNEGNVAGGFATGKGAMDSTYIALAVASAIGVLSVAYMAGRLFGLPQMQGVVQDELLQVVATGAVALLLGGVQAAMDDYGVKMLAAAGADGPRSMLEAASLAVSGLSAKTAGLLNGNDGLLAASRSIGEEASRGVFCNFLGVGFTLVNCSQLNAFRGGITIASFAAMAALADTYAQQFLLSLIGNAAFTFIMPLGLFLRCFRVSRRAGGALVAIGFGFYTVYPSVIVAENRLLHGNNPSSPAGIPKPYACDPRETAEGVTAGQFMGYAAQLTDFGLAQNLTYFVLVRVIFASVLSLIITLGFIRALAHVIGSDIDVSALARIS